MVAWCLLGRGRLGGGKQPAVECAMDGDAAVKGIAYVSKQGMNALRLPAIFQRVGHSNVILATGGGAFRHKDGPMQGAVSCRQVEEVWMRWKAGKCGDCSLVDGIIEYAMTHEELKGAFLTFPSDADLAYPGWRGKLGCSAESLRAPL